MVNQGSFSDDAIEPSSFESLPELAPVLLPLSMFESLPELAPLLLSLSISLIGELVKLPSER